MMKWIKEKRKTLGYSQEDLAVRLQLEGEKIQRATISHWENGLYSPPFERPEFSRALARALKMSVAEVLILAGNRIGEYDILTQQAAEIVSQLSPERRKLAIGLLEQLKVS